MTKQLLCGRQIAAMFLGKNERTVRRWCDNGTLTFAGFDASKRAMVDIEEVLEIFGELRFANHGLAELIANADQGNIEAKNDIGITLLREERPSVAFAFFQDAATHDYPDAMHWLFHCYEGGIGTDRNENLAMMWLNKAAAYGHKIANAQVNALKASQ